MSESTESRLINASDNQKYHVIIVSGCIYPTQNFKKREMH